MFFSTALQAPYGPCGSFKTLNKKSDTTCFLGVHSNKSSGHSKKTKFMHSFVLPLFALALGGPRLIVNIGGRSSKITGTCFLAQSQLILATNKMKTWTTQYTGFGQMLGSKRGINESQSASCSVFTISSTRRSAIEMPIFVPNSWRRCMTHLRVSLLVAGHFPTM
jgi:hypothetical protein